MTSTPKPVERYADLRELIGRIVLPEAFAADTLEAWQRLANADAELFMDPRGPALAKADQILALLPNTDRLVEALVRITHALAKVAPITTNDTAEYAELTFGNHQTQAMTMDPDDWNEIEAAYQAALAGLAKGEGK